MGFGGAVSSLPYCSSRSQAAMERETASWTQPLITTKLRPPVPVAGQRERPRITAILAGALADTVGLTLVVAPPGYGKTVAVASWLGAQALPHAWLSLDPADNDPVRFVRYVVASLEHVRPRIAEAVGDAAVTGGLGAGERLLDALSRADDPCVLVLDDYHVITAEPVHEIVRLLVAQGPPFIHRVIVTREDPPLPLARMRAHRGLVELRQEDLQFTLDEAKDYLAASTDLELDGGQVAQLVERTEGWIAGMQLASISLRNQPDAAAFIEAFAGSQRFVVDYLAAEILDRLDPDLRHFLERISVAPRFSAELCEALSGRGDAPVLLRLAQRMNLFLVPLDPDGRWYRFHHLFADYLRSRLAASERGNLHARAADWFEHAGLPGEAIEQALLNGDPDLTLRLVASAARVAYKLGEFATLLGWVEALPRERLSKDPELLVRAAASLVLVGRLGDAAGICSDAAAALAQQGQSMGRIDGVRALLAAQLGLPEADRLARAAIATIPDDDEFRAFALNALGSVQIANGELVDAAAAMEKALEASLATHQRIFSVLAITRLAAALHLTGHRSRAETWCRRVLAAIGVADGPIRGYPAYVAWRLGMLRYEANDLAEARRELERAWNGLAPVASMRGHVGLAVADMARLRLALGDTDAAIAAIEAVRREGDAAWRASIQRRLEEVEARVRLWSGDLAAAAAWADRAEPTLGPGWDSLPFAMTVARVRLAQRRTAEAQRHLHQARVTARAAGDVADLITIRMLEAARADQGGAPASAQDSIAEAVRLAAPEGYLRRVIDDGRSVAHLLPPARRIAPAFVDAVLEALSTELGASSSQRAGHPQLWRDERGALIEALTARELEVLRLMAAGLGYAAVAEALVVSLATAKWHAAHVRQKLGAQTRSQAVARARELGLV
jgi:LuxR family maltose regulon positive regulatory protein